MGLGTYPYLTCYTPPSLPTYPDLTNFTFDRSSDTNISSTSQVYFDQTWVCPGGAGQESYVFPSFHSTRCGMNGR